MIIILHDNIIIINITKKRVIVLHHKININKYNVIVLKMVY